MKNLINSIGTILLLSVVATIFYLFIFSGNGQYVVSVALNN